MISAFRRRQHTDCPLNRGHPEDCVHICQPNSRPTENEAINVDDTTLNPVQEFTYLSSIIARDGHNEAELQNIMSKAIMSFGRLHKKDWNNHMFP